MVLDFGQRSFGRKVECPMCSLLYCRGDPEDEAAHAKHCDPWRHGVQMPATPWKTERVVLRGTGIKSSSLSAAASSNHGGSSGGVDGGDSGDFRVVEVRNGSDPTAHLAKVAEVFEVMGAALGAESLTMEHTRKARTYVSNGQAGPFFVPHGSFIRPCILYHLFVCSIDRSFVAFIHPLTYSTLPNVLLPPLPL